MDLSPYRVGRRAELMVRRVRLAVLSALILAACGGHGGAVVVPGTIDTPPPTSTQSTTSAVPPTSASSSTSSGTETSAPPTTVTLDLVRQRVIDGYLAGEKAIYEALRDPEHFDLDAIRAAYLPGDALDTMLGNLQKFKDAGWRTKPGPQNLEYAVVENVEISGTSATEATAQVCSVSDGIVYELATGAIVNNTLGVRRTRWTMALDAGQWKRRNVEVLDYTTGQNTCPAAS